jgi:hypothetical protein
MIARLLSRIGLLCGIALVSACGASYQWSQASRANTIAAYEAFLSKEPGDPHAVEARSRIAKLRDEQAWTAAQIASSIQGYQQYLTTEPNGAHAPAAHDEITARERDAAWQTIQSHETAQSLQAFIDKYPTSAEASDARDRLEAIAGYRAELGTANKQSLADRERDELAKRFRKEVQNLVVMAPEGNNPLYRITSAPTSEQNATAICVALRRAGRSCSVVDAGSSPEALRANGN